MIRKIVQVCIVITCFTLSAWWVVDYTSKSIEKDYVPASLKASFAYQAAKWMNDMRAYPANHIPSDWKEKALQQIESEKSRLRKASSAGTQLSWQSVGPTNYGGRVRSIVIDPQHPETMYVGSVSGGIWKTTNGGTKWNPTADAADNMCIGTMVMDPTNPNIIYAGTGEGYFNIDALRGAGVLKTTNGGTSWTMLKNFASPNSRYSYSFINKLVIRPDNPNILYAAMIGGIWKTTNAGANWVKLNTPTSSYFCMDLVASPSNPDLMYATFGLFMPDNDGIYKTTDGGDTWTKLTNGLPDISRGYTRISLALAPSDPNVVYASIADSFYYTMGIYKSTDKGASWSLTAASQPYDNASYVHNTHLGGQGFYNNVIAVHPQNAGIIYAGGINIFKSTNSGAAWLRLIDANGLNNFHVDQHAVVFHPNNPQKMYFGNDGGVYRSTDGGTTFTSLNTGLSVTQFYSGAVHPTNNIFYGGSQDNGTLMASNPPLWSQILGGDGGPVFVDYQNPSNVYMSYVYMTIYKSTSGGPSAFRSMNNIPTAPGAQWVGDRCSFIAPMAMDPTNPLTLYAGSYRLYKTVDGAQNWTTFSSDLTGSGASFTQTDGATITAISVAKSSSSVIYVGTSGWTGVRSRIMVTSNSGGTWIMANDSPLPNREVTSFAIDPYNSSKAYATFSGYNTSTSGTPGHVFLTTNRNSSWTNVSGNLPDVPVNTIVIDPQQLNHLIVGTDLGIFESTNGGTTWTQQNEGLANVAVFDLDLRSDGYLLAATHGRGMFISSSDLNSGLALSYPSQNSSNISPNITLRWKHSDSASTYRLNVGTDPTFETGVILSDTSLTDTAKFISGLSQNQTYYWQVSIRKSSGAIAASPVWNFKTVGAYPSTYSVSGSVSFPNYSEQSTYLPSDYRLVGIPGNSNFKVDSMLSGAHQTQWQVFWDNGGSADYLKEFDGGSDFKFSAGRGFWMLNKGRWSVNSNVPTVPLTSEVAEIPLHAGWNIITNPFNYSVSWQTVRNANSITEQAWGFAGSFTSSVTLEPFQGYYFFNSTNLTTLKIPFGNTAAKSSFVNNFTWSVGISLTSNGMTDESALLGVSPLAQTGLDQFDSRKPRSVGELPSITFERSEWDNTYSHFAMDVKPIFSDLQSWKFNAHAKKGSKTAMTFTSVASVPGNLDVYLIDVERGVVHNVRTNSTYKYTPTTDDHEFEIVIGRSELLDDRIKKVTPKTFFLSDNYPNPFNPATTFEYRLPVASFVYFTIYNTVGQQIATLVSGEQEQGVYTISWNATDFPSGVYLARIQAGTFISVKKILLMK